MIADCLKKLSMDLICSKKYSDLSKSSIITLFEGNESTIFHIYHYFLELGFEKFEAAASIAANILASFFAETKCWILPLKRLIDIAKN